MISNNISLLWKIISISSLKIYLISFITSLEYSKHEPSLVLTTHLTVIYLVNGKQLLIYPKKSLKFVKNENIWLFISK